MNYRNKGLTKAIGFKVTEEQYRMITKYCINNDTTITDIFKPLCINKIFEICRI